MESYIPIVRLVRWLRRANKFSRLCCRIPELPASHCSWTVSRIYKFVDIALVPVILIANLAMVRFEECQIRMVECGTANKFDGLIAWHI
jgi:hypothetical protein